MNRHHPSANGDPRTDSRHAASRRRFGFTLIEVILVLVVIIIVSGITVPYFASTYRGMKLRSAARTIERLSRYGRYMAIMHNQTMTMMIDTSKMEVSLGTITQSSTNAVDGKLDQSVLKRLGYVENTGSDGGVPNMDKEVHHLLPEGLSVHSFKKDETDQDTLYDNADLVNFYPNGQSDSFVLELEDNKGLIMKMENDPITAKVRSEFVQ